MLDNKNIQEKTQEEIMELYRCFWKGRSKNVRQAVELYIDSKRKLSMVDAAQKYCVSSNAVGINVRLLRDQGFISKVENKWAWIWNKPANEVT
jgi:hypothetical protein